MRIKSTKPVTPPVRHTHEAYLHNVAPRLEGVVKNRGIKPKRKIKK